MSTRTRTVLAAAARPADGAHSVSDAHGEAVDWVQRAQEPAGRHRAALHRPTLVSVPARLRGGRLGVSRSAVLAVAAVLAVLVLVVGVRVAWAVRDSQPQTVADPPALSAVDPGPASVAAATAQTSASPTASMLVVHVAGQVAEPGIVRLPPDARVVDAVDAAGGATGEADLSAVNLARPVVDGEQVYVPVPGEVPPAAASVGSSAGGGTGGGTGPEVMVDLNTADLAALDTLPGVGPVLAGRILDWRTEHGRFTSVDELGEVSGIGEKLLAQLRDRARVGP